MKQLLHFGKHITAKAGEIPPLVSNRPVDGGGTEANHSLHTKYTDEHLKNACAWFAPVAASCPDVLRYDVADRTTWYVEVGDIEQGRNQRFNPFRGEPVGDIEQGFGRTSDSFACCRRNRIGEVRWLKWIGCTAEEEAMETGGNGTERSANLLRCPHRLRRVSRSADDREAQGHEHRGISRVQYCLDSFVARGKVPGAHHRAAQLGATFMASAVKLAGRKIFSWLSLGRTILQINS